MPRPLFHAGLALLATVTILALAPAPAGAATVAELDRDARAALGKLYAKTPAAKDGKPKYCYNFYGLNRYTVEGASTIPPGTHQVRMEFQYDGGGLAKGGTVTLYVDGNKAGEGRVEQTEPIIFSADETCDIGFEAGSPVTYDYPARGTKFSGEVTWVELALGKDAVDLDHLISPEERLRVAMAIQ